LDADTDLHLPKRQRMKFPSVKDAGANPKSTSTLKSTSSTKAKGGGTDKVAKAKSIRFHPCSPGQILQMAKLLGVKPDKETYLLPIVKRAVLAPFPEDWMVGYDQMGEVYYYNKYSMKVINVHPMSDYFLDVIDDARARQEAERKRAIEAGEESIKDEGINWMRFGVFNSDEAYYYNFETNLLHTSSQYDHIIDLQMEARRIQTQKAAGAAEDPKAMKKLQAELASKRNLQKMFATGVKKSFVQWVMFLMEVRLGQSKALSKLSIVAGKNEASTFKEWKQRSAELALVRRAMAPFGGRKTKALVRDTFRAWKEFVRDELDERKAMEVMAETFAAWRNKCVKSLHEKRAREILHFMVQGGSISANFHAWLGLILERKDKEVEIIERACIKVQRRYRENAARKAERRAQQNQRKQMKYHLLRVGEGIATTVELNRSASMFKDSPDFRVESPPPPPRRSGGRLWRTALRRGP